MNNSHGGSCLSLDDFDFAEKDHTEAENKPEVAEHPTAENTGPDFLAAFFRSKSSDKNTSFEAVSHNSVAPKKFAKKSQKERKREEQKSQEVGRDIAVCSPKERWSGWGSKSPPESSPSFADILTDEKVAKSQGEPNGSGTKPKAGAGRNRKASWRQLSFDEESAPAVAGKSRQPPSNPWKQLPPMSTNKDLTACNESDRYVVDSLISLDLFDLSLTSYTFFFEIQRQILQGHAATGRIFSRLLRNCAVATRAAPGEAGDELEVAPSVADRREGHGGVAQGGLREPMRESEGGARGEADGPAYLESLQEVTVRQAGMIILLPTYQGIVMRIFVSIRGTG